MIVSIDPSAHRLVVILMPDQSNASDGVSVTITLSLNIVIIHNNSLLIYFTLFPIYFTLANPSPV